MDRLVSLQNDNILSKNVNENKTIDNTIAGSITLIVNWLLAREVESVGYLNSAITGLMNARS